MSMVGDFRSLASKIADLEARNTPILLTLTCGETGRAVVVNIHHIVWLETRRHDWNGTSGYRDADHTRISLSNGDHVWVREDPGLIQRMIQGCTR